ncbi:succinylglutamate desuccinylase/aspartoacylase family protein [Paraliomyxa miuraensis]|nr:succinylglutamate desuccinylase/aspartoacylase family protein [Paraliomyxa miuraensis]
MRRGEPEPFELEGTAVDPGTMTTVDLPIARLPTGDWVHMPVVVSHGKKRGPVVWLSGAVHGDELNGIEIVRRVVQLLDPTLQSGTVLAVPMVNVFGVTAGSRYLPDRRDLNRSFPGTRRGSLTGRLAHAFFERVAKRAELGLDFHTGSGGRTNLPQIRCDISDPKTRRLAVAFGAPLVLDTPATPGTLRAEAVKRGIPVLLFEGGEAGRFHEEVIEAGVSGARRVLARLRMIPAVPAAEAPPVFTEGNRWIRAGRSGFCRVEVRLGERITRKQRVGVVCDAVGQSERVLHAPDDGVVIGVLRTAVVHRGDPVVHMAKIRGKGARKKDRPAGQTEDVST